MKTKIEILCPVCKNMFWRNKSYAEYNLRNGMKNICSRKCLGSYVFSLKSDEEIEKMTKIIKSGPKMQSDELTPFRIFFHKIQTSSKRKGTEKSIPVEISIYDLQEQWNIQNGLCVYTGWQMEYRKRFADRKDINIFTGTVDRIDSTKGYTKDNIQFVCYIAQVAKNKFPESDLFYFCESVVENMGSNGFDCFN